MNIFNTPEAFAWARAFDYVQYKHHCAHIGQPHVSAYAYDKFCDAFEQAMADDPSMKQPIEAHDEFPAGEFPY